MPSNALKFFEQKLLTDVDRLISTHKSISGGRQGRHHLGHITRSGFVMLCAAWELYVELLACEVLGKLIERSEEPKQLPDPVKKYMTTQIAEHKHEDKILILEMAGDGWEDVFQRIAKTYTDGLNSPKAKELRAMFRYLNGVEDLWGNWPTDSVKEIDKFVRLRGDIAHKGSDATYVKINELTKHRKLISDIALKLDNQMQKHIIGLFPNPHKAPWRSRKV